jgi:hypothetical protein
MTIGTPSKVALNPPTPLDRRAPPKASFKREREPAVLSLPSMAVVLGQGDRSACPWGSGLALIEVLIDEFPETTQGHWTRKLALIEVRAYIGTPWEGKGCRAQSPQE